jgi:hypothetical protein
MADRCPVTAQRKRINTSDPERTANQAMMIVDRIQTAVWHNVRGVVARAAGLKAGME